VAQAISLAMFEGPAPEPVASAALALSWVRTARSIEPRAQSAASFAGLLIERTLERHLYLLNAGPERLALDERRAQ
jgi:hypothetical protein